MNIHHIKTLPLVFLLLILTATTIILPMDSPSRSNSDSSRSLSPQSSTSPQSLHTSKSSSPTNSITPTNSRSSDSLKFSRSSSGFLGEQNQSELKILSDIELTTQYEFLEKEIAKLDHVDVPQWKTRLTERNGMRMTQLAALHKEVIESKLSNEQKESLLPFIQVLKCSMTYEEYQKSLTHRSRTNSGKNMLPHLLSMTAHNKLRGSSDTVSAIIAAEECARPPRSGNN